MHLAAMTTYLLQWTMMGFQIGQLCNISLQLPWSILGSTGPEASTCLDSLQASYLTSFVVYQ